MTAYLLLAGIAWAVASRGGTSALDLAVVLGLLGAAVVLRHRWRRTDLPWVCAVGVLLAWILLDGPVRAGVATETVRLPLLVVVATLAVLVVRELAADERETVAVGVVVIGCVQAGIALAEVAAAARDGLGAPPRADALLGSANGLGMLLVATCVLTARELARRGGPLLLGALVLQAAAVLATGSRTAIVVGAALLIGYAATRPDWRVRGCAAAGVLVGGAVVVWRFTTEPAEQRPHLWAEALQRIAAHPLVGAGPLPPPYDTTVPEARVTTHAHDEVLQWGVELGLIGVALGVLAVAIALRGAGRRTGRDPWLVAAAAVLLAAGLTDFTLRITALAVTAATLAAMAALSGSRVPHAPSNDEKPGRNEKKPGLSRPGFRSGLAARPDPLASLAVGSLLGADGKTRPK